jgi:diaminohydroxyphosphoribosylaminopyrimidine deaminase/5-amino-6-(5-phosphoribosylamino)uracil reductase
MMSPVSETDTTPAFSDAWAADHRFMQLALALGRRGLGQTAPNPAVGAVVVKDGIIVGRGWTAPGGRPHAEPQALARAGDLARGATLYVTLEPCSHHGKTPPCADAVIAAGIVRVVSAVEDPNPDVAGQGHGRLRAAGLSVDVGLSADEALRDHAGHFCRVRSHRPHVTLKLAVSCDDYIAAADHKPLAITGSAARDRVHLLRAQSDAILIGIGTAQADDPLLTCRLPGMAARSPVRAVLDTHLRLSPADRLAKSARQTPVWALTSPSAAAPAAALLGAEGVEIIRLAATPLGVELKAVLEELSQRGITRLMVEGGAKVANAFVSQNLVDEIWLLRGPQTLGAGVPVLDGMPLSAITQSPDWRLRVTENLQADILTIYERN